MENVHAGLSKGAEIHFMLRTKGDLDKYIFGDEKHAREWLAQGFVTDEDYKVCRVQARKRKCCGKLYAIRVLKTMKPSEFLAVLSSDSRDTSSAVTGNRKGSRRW